MEWVNEFLALMERIFPASTISKAFQRSFLAAGVVLLWLAIDMVVRRPAGSWLYYRLAAGRRTREAAIIADRVAALEGEASGLELTLGLRLKELEIRSSGSLTPLPAAAVVSSVGVTPLSAEQPAPAPPSLPAGGAPPLPTMAPPPPPPPMFT